MKCNVVMWEGGLVEKKKDELKRTIFHVHHFGHFPLREIRVECSSKIKRCRVKREKKRGANRRSERRVRETKRQRKKK